MTGQLQLWLDDEIVDVVDARYSAFEELKGYLLRAAIQYLTTLSNKMISRQLLVDEGIIDVNFDPTISEVVLITNYRLQIWSALNLLQSWLREPTGKAEGWSISTPNFEKSVSGDVSTENFLDMARRTQARVDSWKNGPRPMAGSILPANTSLNCLYDHVDGNYRVDRIPKTLPPVLCEINLQGLHHYFILGEAVDYARVQEMISFLDKVMPYVDDKFKELTGDIRALFAACPEAGRIEFG